MEDLAAIDPHWAWLTLGLLLVVAEMIAPGLFLIWLGGAALATGLLAWLYPFSPAMQVLLFAALALASMMLVRGRLRRGPRPPVDPLLNDRGARLMGEMVVVTQPIADGEGRVRQGDGEWPATGPDAARGTRMRVIARDGVILSVEPVD